MEERIPSQMTGRVYAARDVVRILNGKQAAAYVANGATLLDVYGSRNYETGEPVLVYIFNRNETVKLYDLWCRHELV
jgi:hypothetical protein